MMVTLLIESATWPPCRALIRPADAQFKKELAEMVVQSTGRSRSRHGHCSRSANGRDFARATARAGGFGPFGDRATCGRAWKWNAEPARPGNRREPSRARSRSVGAVQTRSARADLPAGDWSGARGAACGFARIGAARSAVGGAPPAPEDTGGDLPPPGTRLTLAAPRGVSRPVAQRAQRLAQRRAGGRRDDERLPGPSARGVLRRAFRSGDR